MKNRFILFLFGFFALIAIASTADIETTKITPETPVDIEVSARKLFADYQANEIAADETYNGKVLQVSGTIRDIGNDLLDNAYISIAGDQYFGDVQCFIADKAVVAKLRKGSFITVKGECDGLLMNVILQRAIVIE
jgi:hypothetical protein